MIYKPFLFKDIKKKVLCENLVKARRNRKLSQTSPRHFRGPLSSPTPGPIRCSMFVSSSERPSVCKWGHICRWIDSFRGIKLDCTPPKSTHSEVSRVQAVQKKRRSLPARLSCLSCTSPRLVLDASLSDCCSLWFFCS